MKRFLIVIGILILAWLGYGIFVEPNWLHVHTVEVEIEGLPPELEGFTILHLSDLHQRRFGANQNRLLKAIEGQEYHMVALTGDILSHPRPPDIGPTEELLAGLKGPVFFVPGNHDYPELILVRETMERFGAHMLENSHHVLEHNGTPLAVAGVHDPLWGSLSRYGIYQPDLAAALPGDDSFVLLLAHSPGILEEAARWDAPLVLVGHTHGGQIKIPLLGAPITGSGRLFDRYVQGLYTKNNTSMYINRGLGNTTLPIRFLSRPEVVFIRLVGR